MARYPRLLEARAFLAGVDHALGHGMVDEPEGEGQEPGPGPRPDPADPPTPARAAGSSRRREPTEQSGATGTLF
jgi:hypothetical protein